MKKLSRAFLCLTLCLLLMALAFTGCGGETPGSSESFTGEVLSINGEPVDADLVSYLAYVLSVQALSSDNAFFDSEENVAALKTAVVEQVKEYMLPVLMANDKAISLSEEDEARIAQQVQTLIETVGGEEAYDAALAQIHMTRALQENVIRTQILQEKMLIEAYGDDIRSGVYRAKHVLLKYDEIPTDEDGNPTMTEEEWRADRLKLAQALSERAKNGEDFDTLIAEYNEDGGMAANPDGYYFIEGQMQPAFYEGTKSLEIGGISDPVEVSDYYKGFHIIQRLEPEESAVEAQLAQFAASSEKAQSDANTAFSAIKVTEGAGLDAVLKQEIASAKQYISELNASSSSAAGGNSPQDASSSAA